ncbi:hypothetical protein MPH_13860 [Macrophomina phaseolina MS6]|uniref:Peptidase S9 prolyl oligopeptidase catalytic domain-containing protein n=2 Tax=Macrophomina phaseolina TaxID=35725 RepID=K2R4L6_MACPH|nr:hypothetical protein MPH_13860 [Macrophomina phaseolina MS6]
MAALGGAQNFSSSTNSQRPADSSNPPVIADSTLSRFGLINEIIEGGRLLDYFPEIERVHPLERLNNGACMPPTFLIHGLDDRVVPCSQSEVFAKKILAQTPNANVHLELQPGDHLMDIPLQLGHPWLVKGIRLVTDAWLG